MKNKEVTIYDNYYSLENEKEIREFLFDEYAEEIPEERVWDEIEFQDRELWSDVKTELTALFDKNVYLLTGTCGVGTGPRKAANSFAR